LYANSAGSSQSQGKTSIYLTGNITNAAAAAKIANELGPNTDNIYVLNTTQLTTINLSSLVTAPNIRISNNTVLTNINLNGLTTVYDSFEVYDNTSLSSISLPALTSCSDLYLGSNPSLSSISLPALTFCRYLSLGHNSLSTISLPALTYCSELRLGNNSLSTSTVNSILNRFLTVLPLSGKSVSLNPQTPPAPPTAQGIIDKQTLVDAGNTITVDCNLTVSTTAITTITPTSAASGGKVNSSGAKVNSGSQECYVYNKGVCWSTNPNPTTALATKTNDYDYNQNDDSTFSSSITGLTSGTTYYVRAYAAGNESIAYGNEVSFTTTIAESIVTTTIGTQNWTTKNLDVATYSDGTVIPEVKDPTAWANLTTGAWCYYNDNSANGTTYGKLYNWYAAAGIWNEASKTDTSQRKKLAPTGYHIPSDTEWATLIDYLGGEFVAGGKMKETGTAQWLSPNKDATNSSGFTALPANVRDYEGTFINDPTFNLGAWWSLLENAATSDAWLCTVSNDTANIDRFFYFKTCGLSVRCLKD
jgi:uncharacterized protein (TIGR02145 family)